MSLPAGEFVEIRLSGPGKNALSTPLMEGALARLDAAAGGPVLFSGEGGALSSGLDLRELATLSEAGILAYLELVERFFTRVFTHPGPTVALVEGHAIAGGAVLAIACDRRVASGALPKARFGLNETANAMIFPPRVLSILRHKLSRHAWYAAILSGQLFDLPTALRHGLVEEVRPTDEEARASAEALIRELSRMSRTAYAATKAELQAEVVAGFPADDARFRSEVVPRWQSPDLRAEMAAAILGRRG